jgi:alanyl-tRNA synthetase
VPFLLERKHPSGQKLVNVQKCLRTDDIEEVGDNTHGTFFEMLGNWSLGNYFKEQAISMSFKFLTEELKLDKKSFGCYLLCG